MSSRVTGSHGCGFTHHIKGEPWQILVLTLEGQIACVKAGSVGSFTSLPEELLTLTKNELWFDMEKIWQYIENYWNLIYMKQNNDTIPKTIKLWFTMEKTMALYQKLLNFNLLGENMALIKSKTVEL